MYTTESRIIAGVIQGNEMEDNTRTPRIPVTVIINELIASINVVSIVLMSLLNLERRNK